MYHCWAKIILYIGKGLQPYQLHCSTKGWWIVSRPRVKIVKRYLMKAETESFKVSPKYYKQAHTNHWLSHWELKPATKYRSIYFANATETSEWISENGWCLILINIFMVDTIFFINWMLPYRSFKIKLNVFESRYIKYITTCINRSAFRLKKKTFTIIINYVLISTNRKGKLVRNYVQMKCWHHFPVES